MEPRIRVFIGIVLAAFAIAVPALADAPTSVQAVVRDARTLLQPVIEHRHLQVELRVPPEATIGSEDPELAKERVINLLANALAIAPEGGRISVECDSATRSFTVRIANDRVQQTMERTITDQVGNVFTVRSVAGSGTQLTLRFDVSDAPGPAVSRQH